MFHAVQAVCIQRAPTVRLNATSGSSEDFVKGLVYWTSAPNSAFRDGLQMGASLMHAQYILMCLTWRKSNANQYRLQQTTHWSNVSFPHWLSWFLSAVRQCPICLLYFFFIYWQTPLHLISNWMCCNSHLLASFGFPSFFFFSHFVCLSHVQQKSRQQWHFLLHLKGLLLQSSISWAHMFMLMKPEHDCGGGGGFRKHDIYQRWLLAGVLTHIWCISL